MSISPLAPRRVPLEVAVFSGATAIQAQTLGASRVELNSPASYAVGGLTPPIDELGNVTLQLTIPVHVMIRNRAVLPDEGPDFIYNSQDVAGMILSINRFKDAGVMDLARGDRFVFGALHYGDAGNKRLVVDETVCKALVEVAKPFGCVFHRAFDPIAALPPHISSEVIHLLKRIGFKAVLTAGGPLGSCCDKPNVENIEKLCPRRHGGLPIIAGGGLRTHNVDAAAARLAVFTPVHGSDKGSSIWFHTAALRVVDGQCTEYLDFEELRGLVNKLSRVQLA